jgi:hypothetical protein
MDSYMQGTVDARDRLGFHPFSVDSFRDYVRAYIRFLFSPIKSRDDRDVELAAIPTNHISHSP